MTEERDNSGGDRISELKDRTQNWPNLNNREKNTEKKNCADSQRSVGQYQKSSMHTVSVPDGRKRVELKEF